MFQIRLPESVHDFPLESDALAFQSEHGGEMLQIDDQPPDLPTKPIALGTFRTDLLVHPGFAVTFASMPVVHQHGLSNEIYADAPLWGTIAMIWNSAIAIPSTTALSAESVDELNAIAHASNIPLVWGTDSTISTTENV